MDIKGKADANINMNGKMHSSDSGGLGVYGNDNFTLGYIDEVNGLEQWKCRALLRPSMNLSSS
jgi:hypothetical protein